MTVLLVLLARHQSCLPTTNCACVHSWHYILYTVTSIGCDVNPCVNGSSCIQHGDNVTGEMSLCEGIPVTCSNYLV